MLLPPHTNVEDVYRRLPQDVKDLLAMPGKDADSAQLATMVALKEAGLNRQDAIEVVAAKAQWRSHVPQPLGEISFRAEVHKTWDRYDLDNRPVPTLGPQINKFVELSQKSHNYDRISDRQQIDQLTDQARQVGRELSQNASETDKIRIEETLRSRDTTALSLYEKFETEKAREAQGPKLQEAYEKITNLSTKQSALDFIRDQREFSAIGKEARETVRDLNPEQRELLRGMLAENTPNSLSFFNRTERTLQLEQLQQKQRDTGMSM
jgi:hypothetical protein